MQSWKKAVFFGGAVLVLAACSDATSPALSKVDGPAASYTKKADASTLADPTTTTTTSDSTNTIKTECSGGLIHWGQDATGTLVPICVTIIYY